MKTFTIYHTNDVHSHFEAFCRIGTFLKENRHPDTDLLLDAGDFCDAESVMISGTDSVGGIALLKEAQYDALAVGNNEFFQGIGVLETMANQGFPVLSTNLTDFDDQPIRKIQPYCMLNRNGIRVLVIGLCPYFQNPTFTDMVGIRTLPPVSLVQEILDRQKGHYDLAIVLSHLGLRRDIELAQSVNGISCIIGGHSHTLMEDVEIVNGTIIHQSGKHGTYLGKLVLSLDEQNQVVACTGSQIDCSDYEEDIHLKKIWKSHEQKGIVTLSQPIRILDHDLHYDPFKPCEAMTTLCNLLKEHYPCEFALMHHGILTGDIRKEVSKLSLLEACPSPLNPTRVKWYGKQIREAYLASLDELFIHQSGAGSGFRGNNLGTLSFSSNVEIVDGETFVDGEQLQDDRIYLVMSDDYLQRGTWYEMLKTDFENAEYFSGYIRDALEKYLV